MESVLPLVWIMTWSDVTRPGKRFAQMVTLSIAAKSVLEVSETKAVQEVISWPSFKG